MSEKHRNPTGPPQRGHQPLHPPAQHHGADRMGQTDQHEDRRNIGVLPSQMANIPLATYNESPTPSCSIWLRHFGLQYSRNELSLAFSCSALIRKYRTNPSVSTVGQIQYDDRTHSQTMPASRPPPTTRRSIRNASWTAALRRSSPPSTQGAAPARRESFRYQAQDSSSISPLGHTLHYRVLYVKRNPDAPGEKTLSRGQKAPFLS